MTLKLQVTALTHPGLVREHNEDAIAVGGWFAPGVMTAPYQTVLDLSDVVVCLVADGLGGHAGGEIASALAVSRLSAAPHELLSEEALQQAIRGVSDEIVQRASAEPALRGMGTTLVGVVARETVGVMVNVGDSRAYCWEGGYLGQLSVDDSLNGQGTSHIVTQSLGGGQHLPAPRPHLVPLALRLGDRYLLCSDGLTDYASLDVLEKCMTRNEDRAAAQGLFEAALAGGGGDNVSLLLLRVLDQQRGLEPPTHMDRRGAAL